MQKLKTYNSIVSILALLCLAVGWIKPFNFEMNVMIYNRLLYIFFGIGFLLQTKISLNPKMIYPMYAAACLCIFGAFLPLEGQWKAIKSIGLFAGIIITFFNRRKA